MHKSQSYICLRTALHVLGFTITHLQEHKTTVTTVSGNHYTYFVLLKMGDSETRNM
jgi:hypothetical protein